MRTFAQAPTADVTQWTYHPVTGHLLSKIFAAPQMTGGSATESYTYAMDGQLQTVHRQSGAVITTVYNELGLPLRIVSTGVNAVAPVYYEYDSLSGRRSAVIDSGGRHTLTYDDHGLPTGESISAVPWNSADPIYSIGLLDGASISYGYDSQQRRQSLSAYYAGQLVPTTNYYYSPLGRLSRVTTGDGIQVDYAYVPNSTLVEHRDYSAGQGRIMATAHGYDARNNLTDVVTTRDASPGAATLAHHYTVDVLNRRTLAEREDRTRWEYAYDARSQITSGRKTFAGQPLAGAQVQYAYDGLGNRTQSQAGGKADGSGLRLTTYARNKLNQYTTINRNTKVDLIGTRAGTETIAVKNAVTGSPVPVETDSATSWWRAELTPTSPSFAAATVWRNGVNLDPISGSPRLVPSYPTPVTMTYDADGNLTYDGRSYYVWDSLGRLTAAQVPGHGGYSHFQLTFVYDAMGRRIGKSVSGQPINASYDQNLFTEIYLYDTWNDGWNLVATYRINGAATNMALFQTYTWGLDFSGTMLGAGGVGGLLVATSYDDWGPLNSWETYALRPVPRFPAYDGNGNVMALINAKTMPASDGGAGMIAGSIDASYEYDPFGKTLRATGPAAASNPFRFSTKFTDDETGLCYYGYRYYDPVLGRWLSRDPIAEEGGVNLYGMCGNRALNDYDRLGQFYTGTSYDSSKHGVGGDIKDRCVWLIGKIELGHFLGILPTLAMDHSDKTKSAYWNLSADEAGWVKKGLETDAVVEGTETVFSKWVKDAAYNARASGGTRALESPFEIPATHFHFKQESAMISFIFGGGPKSSGAPEKRYVRGAGYYTFGDMYVSFKGSISSGVSAMGLGTTVNINGTISISDTFVFALPKYKYLENTWKPTGVGYRLETNGYLKKYNTSGSWKFENSYRFWN